MLFQLVTLPYFTHTDNSAVRARKINVTSQYTVRVSVPQTLDCDSEFSFFLDQTLWMFTFGMSWCEKAMRTRSARNAFTNRYSRLTHCSQTNSMPCPSIVVSCLLACIHKSVKMSFLVIPQVWPFVAHGKVTFMQLNIRSSSLDALVAKNVVRITISRSRCELWNACVLVS